MTNGGTGPYKGALLLVNSGRGETYPPSVVSVNPYPPYNSTIMVDNYHGKDFNSLNDIRVHPNTGNIYFTDAPYGFLQDFRPKLGLPNQVYMLDTKTGNLRVVADGFSKSNGLAFSPDGKTAYMYVYAAHPRLLMSEHDSPEQIVEQQRDSEAWTGLCLLQCEPAHSRLRVYL